MSTRIEQTRIARNRKTRERPYPPSSLFLFLTVLLKCILLLLDSGTRIQNHHLFHLLQPNSQEPPCWDWPQQQGRIQSCSHISIPEKLFQPIQFCYIFIYRTISQKNSKTIEIKRLSTTYRVYSRNKAINILQIFNCHVFSLWKFEYILFAIYDFHTSIRLPLTNVTCKQNRDSCQMSASLNYEIEHFGSATSLEVWNSEWILRGNWTAKNACLKNCDHYVKTLHSNGMGN